MKIAFIIVTYHTTLKEISRLKKEVNDIGLEEFKVYIIDNTKNNKGFAYGVNQGIRQGLKDKADYFIILNPDISLTHLRGAKWLDGRRYYHIWGGTFIQNRKKYYGGKIDPWQLTGGLIEEKPKERFTQTDFVSGSLMIIDKNVIDKVGFFDERFFMYYEDVDYCLRSKKLGFNIGIDSSLIYEHFERSKNLPEKEKLLERSRWRFFVKHSSLKQKIYELIRLPKTALEILLKKKFLINFLSFNLSSLTNKLLNFILFIFLIKYLQVEEYGIYNLIWAQVALLTPLVDLGTTSYGLVYLPAEKKEQFMTLFNFRFILSIIIFLLTILLSVFIFKNKTNMILYTVLLSFTIFSNMLSGSYLILTSIKEKLYKSSILSIGFNFSLITCTIFGLILSKSLFVIFVIIFIFYNLYSIVNYWLLKENLQTLVYKFFDQNWLNVLQKSYLFVLISIFANLYFKIDLFLLNFLRGETSVAIYSAGYKFLEALIFIAASYTISATPILSKLAKNNFKQLIEKIKRDGFLLFILGWLISFSILVFGPILLPLILKQGYQSSIRVAQIVTFALPFVLINTIFYNLLYIFNQAKLVVYLFIFQFVVNTILNLIFIPQYGFFASAYLTVLSEVINTIISFVFVYENLGRRRRLVSSQQ